MTLVEWMDRTGYMRGSHALWDSIERGRKNHNHANRNVNVRFLDMRSRY